MSNSSNSPIDIKTEIKTNENNNNDKKGTVVTFAADTNTTARTKRGRPPATATTANGKPKPKRKKRDSKKHNEEEYRRRKRIRERFEELKIASQSRHGEREKVLICAVERIEEYKQKIKDLETKNSMLERNVIGDMSSVTTTSSNVIQQFMSPNGVRHFNVPMVSAMVDGRFSGCNEAFSTISGFSGDEVTKRTLFTVTKPDQLPTTCIMWQEILSAVGKQQHISLELDSVWLRKDGTSVPVHVTCFTMTTAGGFKEPSYLVFIVVPKTPFKSSIPTHSQQDHGDMKAAQVLAQFPGTLRHDDDNHSHQSSTMNSSMNSGER